VVRGALSACHDMMVGNKWRKMNATAIEVGLDAAEVLVAQVKPHYINVA
jgi:hypothetical protein